MSALNANASDDSPFIDEKRLCSERCRDLARIAHCGAVHTVTIRQRVQVSSTNLRSSESAP